MVSISLCMIVKNEEVHLADCLKSIAAYVNEIIIVDTGSEDRTKEIALQYTDKVYDYHWKKDFSAARNYSVSKASNEYILSLDSDEITKEIDISVIQHLICHHPNHIGRLMLINEFTRKGETYRSNVRLGRLFSNKYYQYSGPIHEQLVPLGDIKLEYYDIPLFVLHLGYEGNVDTRRKKTERNISLLKNALEGKPGDPYLLYQLGKSYYMEEDYATACDYFGQALYFDLDPRLEYVQDMVESYGYSLINSEQYETALQLLNIYDEFAHSADFVFLIAMILMNNGKFDEAIKEFLKASNQKEAKMEGVNGYLAFYNIGVIFECLGDNNNAIKYYEKCGEYSAAKLRVKALQ